MRVIFRKIVPFEKWRFFFIFAFAVGSISPVLAAPQTTAVNSDSLFAETKIDLQLSEIDRKAVALNDSNLAGEVRLFETLARTAQKKGDFKLAAFYVQSALELLAPQKEETDSTISEKNFSLPTGSSVFQNQWNVSSGMDISRQDFEIVYSGRDSNLIDATNNPFVGIGFNGFGQGRGEIGLNWNGSARFSRDYTLADLHASAQKNLPASQTVTAWTDFEAMSYRRDFTMKYAQGLGGVQWQGNWENKLNALLEDEFSSRHYSHPDQNFPDYFRNRLWGYVKIYPPGLRWIRLSGEFENRKHRRFSELDYSQRQVSIRTSARFFKTQMTLQLDRRLLDYKSDGADTLFYFGSYRDWFASLSLKRPLIGALAFKTNGFFVNRDYTQKSSFLVDYRYFNVIPAIEWSVSSNLNVDLGYLFIQKKYRRSNVEEAYWAVKDYSVRGLQLSVDFLNFRNLMFSAQISYEMRRHGGSSEEGDEGFNLYTNQNETTAMLFASWQFLSNYELNVVLHRDAAIDQELEHNDSRVSIFTLELRREF